MPDEPIPQTPLGDTNQPTPISPVAGQTTTTAASAPQTSVASPDPTITPPSPTIQPFESAGGPPPTATIPKKGHSKPVLIVTVIVIFLIAAGILYLYATGNTQVLDHL